MGVSVRTGVIASLLLLLVVACNGNPQNGLLHSAVSEPEELNRLQELLVDEMARLGKDPAEITPSAPLGESARVFDLEAAIMFGTGPEVPDIVSLEWTGQLPGDYDQNGEVNESDLQPLAVNLGRPVDYRESPPNPAVSWWPVGDPEEAGDVAPQDLPMAGTGAANWRLARVDGDHNGEINVSDVTTIAGHFGERKTSYSVYRKSESEEKFSRVYPPEAGGDGLLERIHAGPGRPERYRFAESLPGPGLYAYYVAPYDDQTGSEGARSHQTTVLSTLAPSLELSATPARGVVPLLVTFSARGHSVSREIAGYGWDFDSDGELEAFGDELDSVTYLFEESGLQQVTATVYDSDGKVSSAQIEVLAGAAPVAEFTASPAEGPPPLDVVFDSSGSFDPDGRIVSFEWDLDGDGTYETADGTDPTVEKQYPAGVFSPSLRVTDDQGFQSTATTQLLSNTPPVAFFSDTTADEPGNRVTFSSVGSYDPDGHDITLYWDFDADGEADRIDHEVYDNVSYTYLYFRSYGPKLEVKDELGSSDTFRLIISVWAAPEPQLRVDPNFGSAPLEVTLDASGSHDHYDDITGYEFDFEGDGEFDTGVLEDPVITHSYTTADAFSPVVRVTNSEGHQATRTYESVVTVAWDQVLEIDCINLGWIDCMQLGDRLTLAFYANGGGELDEGLYFQISDAGGFSSWSTPPLLLDPRYCRDAELDTIDGNPCVLYRGDISYPQLYIAVADDPTGSDWSNPVWLAQPNYRWSDTVHELQNMNGKPAVLFSDETSIGNAFYLIESGTALGTSWEPLRLLFQDVHWPERTSMHFSTVGGTINVMYVIAGYAYWAIPDDPSLTSWTTYMLNQPDEIAALPPHQPVSEYGGSAFTAFNLDSLISLATLDTGEPDYRLDVYPPINRDPDGRLSLQSMVIGNGLPRFVVSQAVGPEADAPNAQTWYYEAQDPELASWEWETVTATDGLLVELVSYDAQQLMLADTMKAQVRLFAKPD